MTSAAMTEKIKAAGRELAGNVAKLDDDERAAAERVLKYVGLFLAGSVLMHAFDDNAEGLGEDVIDFLNEAIPA